MPGYVDYKKIGQKGINSNKWSISNRLLLLVLIDRIAAVNYLNKNGEVFEDTGPTGRNHENVGRAEALGDRLSDTDKRVLMEKNSPYVQVQVVIWLDGLGLVVLPEVLTILKIRSLVIWILGMPVSLSPK